ncbi:MAG: YlbF family regulator [Eubacteriales bacterium]|nr:YlbF family regulator [Eubacteriales bacterium]
MSRVRTAMEELIAAVIASPEYREFDRQKQIMKEHPELKRQIDRFREENFRLQHSVQSDELFDRIDEFSRKYEDFRRNPLVDPFLNAEVEFCRMIQGINQEIVEAVNFE